MAYTRDYIERPEKLVLATDAGEPLNAKGEVFDDRCALLDVTGARGRCVAWIHTLILALEFAAAGIRRAALGSITGGNLRASVTLIAAARLVAAGSWCWRTFLASISRPSTTSLVPTSTSFSPACFSAVIRLLPARISLAPTSIGLFPVLKAARACLL
jgi:hypothetical protein